MSQGAETPQILDHGFKSTCGFCKYTDNMDLFTSTAKHGDFEPGHYQCPNCGKAWKLGLTAGKRQIIEVEAIA